MKDEGCRMKDKLLFKNKLIKKHSKKNWNAFILFLER